MQKPIIASMISELLQIMDESMEFIHPIVVIGSGSPQQVNLKSTSLFATFLSSH